MFKNIMLAYDGSENAFRAAEKVASIAMVMEGANVTIVYVVDSATSKGDVLHYSSKEQINEIRRQRINKVLEYLEEQGISHQHEVLHGEAPIEIVKYANAHHFDLVAVGSRGLNALQELVLGSVSHKVAKRANCPVLIVK